MADDPIAAFKASAPQVIVMAAQYAAGASTPEGSATIRELQVLAQAVVSALQVIRS
jgi:hypothetical protein